MSHNIIDITAQNFEEQVINGNHPVLLEFSTEWCAPCKMLKPIMDTLADKYEGQMTVGIIDSDKNHQLVQQYGVMGIPTLLLFVGGEPVERLVGFQPQGRIEAKLQNYLTTQNA